MTDETPRLDPQLQRWNALFSDTKYFYGAEPGPVARRAVRYSHGRGTALDVGCGEGQDLAFLAESGFEATGLEGTPSGVAKTRALLRERDLKAQVVEENLKSWRADAKYDLVIAVNSIQFLGEQGSECLNQVLDCVAPNGIIGLSLFSREAGQAQVENGLFLIARDELLKRLGAAWQPIEAAHLYQWSAAHETPQAFVTLIARRRN